MFGENRQCSAMPKICHLVAGVGDSEEMAERLRIIKSPCPDGIGETKEIGLKHLVQAKWTKRPEFCLNLDVIKKLSDRPTMRISCSQRVFIKEGKSTMGPFF